MKLRNTLICCSIALLSLPAISVAGEIVTHSVYRVTSYNFNDFNDLKSDEVNTVRQNNPLMITGRQTDILSDFNLDSSSLSASAKSSATSGFAVSAQYAPTSKLALQGAIGMTKSDWEPGSLENHSSWEANLGIIYNLFNNVSYGVHFGYMDTGDVYKRRNSYSDVESVIMVSNQLTLSF